MNVFFTLLVLAAASAQEPLLPAFVLAGRADLLPARAEATAAALREAVLARALREAVLVDAPPVEDGAAERRGDVLQCIHTRCRTAKVRQRVPGRVPEPIYIKRVAHEGGPVPGDVPVEDEVRRRHVAVHVVVDNIITHDQPVGRVVAHAAGLARAAQVDERFWSRPVDGVAREREREVAPSFFMHGEEAYQLIGVDGVPFDDLSLIHI